MDNSNRAPPWYRQLNRFQWMVLAIAILGWLFDCFDQQLFAMSRSMVMRDLAPDADLGLQTRFGGYATTAFILGWAAGGLIFGVLGDVWGRAKTMALTILIYAVFTGLSALSRSWLDFSIYRFFTGLGVGGEFAVGVALVAEVLPDRARAPALGLLQACTVFGNLAAALLIGAKDSLGGWRGLYLVGAAPALLAFFVRWKLNDLDRGTGNSRAHSQASALTSATGCLTELMGTPRWRKNAIIGLALAVAGVFGLWGVAFWSGELIDSTLPTMDPQVRASITRVVEEPDPKRQAELAGSLAGPVQRAYLNLYKYTLPFGVHYDETMATTQPIPAVQQAKMKALLSRALDPKEEPIVKRNAFMLQQAAGFVGIMFLTFVAGRVGRRAALAIAMLAGFTGASVTFYLFTDRSQILWLWPLLGFCTLMPFGGFAIYFPELFPTRLRSTGISFCYNVGRFITAFGPLILPWLAMEFHGHFEIPGFRVAAIVLSGAYFIGLAALLWAPETKGQPLPEED